MPPVTRGNKLDYRQLAGRRMERRSVLQRGKVSGAQSLEFKAVGRGRGRAPAKQERRVLHPKMPGLVIPEANGDQVKLQASSNEGDCSGSDDQGQIDGEKGAGNSKVGKRLPKYLKKGTEGLVVRSGGKRSRIRSTKKKLVSPKGKRVAWLSLSPDYYSEDNEIDDTMFRAELQGSLDTSSSSQEFVDVTGRLERAKQRLGLPRRKSNCSKAGLKSKQSGSKEYVKSSKEGTDFDALIRQERKRAELLKLQKQNNDLEAELGMKRQHFQTDSVPKWYEYSGRDNSHAGVNIERGNALTGLSMGRSRTGGDFDYVDNCRFRGNGGETLKDLRSLEGLAEKVEEDMTNFGLLAREAENRLPSSGEHKLGKDKNVEKLKSGAEDVAVMSVKKTLFWPQAYLKYSHARKQYKFVDLPSFNLLVAGEIACLLSGELSECEIRARLQLLRETAYHCENFTWDSVRDFHYNVMLAVERGDKDWGDSLIDIQANTLLSGSQWRQSGSQGSYARKTEGSGQAAASRKFWCGEFQRNMCKWQGAHEGVVKGVRRWLEHICAACLQRGRAVRYHGEASRECPMSGYWGSSTGGQSAPVGGTSGGMPPQAGAGRGYGGASIGEQSQWNGGSGSWKRV